MAIFVVAMLVMAMLMAYRHGDARGKSIGDARDQRPYLVRKKSEQSSTGAVNQRTLIPLMSLTRLFKRILTKTSELQSKIFCNNGQNFKKRMKNEINEVYIRLFCK